MKITFLIPAYNEARTIAEVLDRIAALGLDYETIVVDDGSTDTTADIVASRADRERTCTCCASQMAARDRRCGMAFRIAMATS